MFLLLPLLLCLSCIWIQLVLTELGEEEMHVHLNLLQVGKHVGALLAVDAGYAIEELTLEAQCHRCARLADLPTSLLHIDLLNGFTGHLLS